MHSMLSTTSSYQASSIHSRRRVTYGDSTPDGSVIESLPPRPPAPLPTSQTPSKWDDRAAKDRRLMSDLWCMSAATFRRFGKIEQARGAIQEAEARDGNNPAVWVQVGDPFVVNYILTESFKVRTLLLRVGRRTEGFTSPPQSSVHRTRARLRDNPHLQNLPVTAMPWRRRVRSRPGGTCGRSSERSYKRGWMGCP